MNHSYTQTVAMLITVILCIIIISSCSAVARPGNVTEVSVGQLSEDVGGEPAAPVSTDAESTGDTIPETTPEVTTADETTVPDTTSDETTANKDETDEPQPKATVKNMLAAALEPVGRCLYVWGGGWNEEDTGAGVDAMTLGASPRWLEFFGENGRDYDYHDTRYQIHDGLDCSGYIGYVTYQAFGEAYSDNGYVFKSGRITEEFRDLFGGVVTNKSNISEYQPCDIMGKSGHAYIVIGQCSDGSVLFMHASPPAVSLCGTPSENGKTESEAVRLAAKYMSKYRPESYEKFDTCSRGMSYLTDYDQYRWSTETLADPDGYRNMSVEEILADLFGE